VRPSRHSAPEAVPFGAGEIYISFNALSFWSVILMRVRQVCAGLPRARRYIQGEVIMIDQDIRFLAAGRQEQKAEIERTIAAIISTTRRAWLSRGCEPLTHDRNDGNRNRLAHPMIRFAFDPKRINAWRARVGRHAPESVGT